MLMRRTNHRSVRRFRARSQRRGVVLLVVLTLLSLFIVISTTFLLLAGTYRRSAESQRKEELIGDPPQKLIDMVIRQVIRGTENPDSDIGANALLSDLYGFDGFIAYGILKSTNANSIVLHVPAPPVTVIGPNGQIDLSAVPIDPFIGDRPYWRTIRDRSQPYFYNEPAISNIQVTQRPSLPHFFTGQYLTFINAPEGFHNVTFPITGYIALDADQIGGSLPNANPYPYAEITLTWPNNTYSEPSQPTMAANAQPDTVVEILVNGRPFNGTTNSAFAGYANYPDETYDYPDEHNVFLADENDLTKPSYRPLPPTPVTVDSNGDRVKESFFIDAGLPLQTGSSGRLVKPMAAIHCIDLDGRLNLNFHGAPAHLNTPPSFAVLAGDTAVPYKSSRQSALPTLQNVYYGNPFSFAAHGQGVGYGVADVNLLDLLAQSVADRDSTANATQIAQQWLDQLFYGISNPMSIVGRYGASGTPGVPNADAPFTALKFLPYTTANGYYDFHSALRSGFDPRGMPVFEPRYHSSLEIDSPYETSAEAPRGTVPMRGAEIADELFTLNDLEAILRAWDWDAPTIPSRIHDLSPVLNGSPLSKEELFRDSVTTESWHLPVLNIQGNRDNTTRYNSFVDLVSAKLNLLTPLERARILRELTTVFNASQAITSQDSGYNPVVGPLVAPDLMLGLPMDLNRPFTNLAERRRMAAQLYLLLLTVGDVDPAMWQSAAQWAINAVEFRDGDSVMTAFEYDTNPFNGWDVDGDPFGPVTQDRNPTEANIIWGCERPELLISECFAFHDFRQRDNNGTTEQEYRPRGSAFIELYNPWASKQYQSQMNTFAGGINLAANLSGSPVWRLNIEAHQNADPNSPMIRNPRVYFTQPTTPAAIIPGETYFSDIPAPSLRPGQYAIVGSSGWLVDPNNMPVAAPPNVPDIDSDGNDDYPSMLGMKTTDVSPGAVDYLMGRRIQLSIIDGLSYLWRVESNSQFPPVALPPRQVPAVIVNRFVHSTGNIIWRSLNISEPPNGYLYDANPPVTNRPDPANFSDYLEQKYTTPGTPEDDPLVANLAYRVKLERLADPTLPFDPLQNPYIMVDSTSSATLNQLRAFNGSGNVPTIPQPTDLDADERGKVANSTLVRLWSSRDWNPSTTPAPPPLPAISYYVTPVLNTTFGYLNSHSVPLLQPMASPPPSDPLNGGFEIPPDHFVGAPTEPFPWLTWTERPYLNQFELLQVPASAPEELTDDFELPDPPPTNSHLFPFTDTTRQHFQVLRFTTTRSRFLGTDTFVTGGSIPRAREPGRVNINTVRNETSWLALWNGAEVSQLGQPLGNSWIPQFNEVTTARTSNAFGGGNELGTDQLTDDELLALLMADYPNNTYTHLNGNKHWYSRYAALNRLGNVVSTHSNVFAVWVTIGYFEVDPQTGAVMQELGADSGDIRRHRAFYVIDRSVPVAFEPDHNHNIERAVLLRRFIE